MNISQIITLAAFSNEIEQPGLFPFPFKLHLAFCIISLLFFFYQFFKERKYYQLIMGVAIPFSLVIWISNGRTLFYGVGIIEAVFLAAAFAASIFDKKRAQKKQEAGSANTASDSETMAETSGQTDNSDSAVKDSEE